VVLEATRLARLSAALIDGCLLVAPVFVLKWGVAYLGDVAVIGHARGPRLKTSGKGRLP
jgi:hypothetical protein